MLRQIRTQRAIPRLRLSHSPHLATVVDLSKEDYREALKRIDIEGFSRYPQPSQHIISPSMESYLTSYGYLNSFESSSISSLIGLGALSALHTYPLTLSLAIEKILPSPVNDLSVLVLGARAESSLPPHWWRQTLIASYKLHRLHILFQGPHCATQGASLAHSSSHSSEQKVIVDWNHGGGCEQNRNVTLEWCSERGSFHTNPSAQKLLSSADIVVLFNPGYGHHYLKAEWRPTLAMLLRSKIPIVCTALSPHDLQRDRTALEKLKPLLDYKYLIEPQSNTFASLVADIDPKEPQEENKRIVCNQYMYAFQGE